LKNPGGLLFKPDDLFTEAFDFPCGRKRRGAALATAIQEAGANFDATARAWVRRGVFLIKFLTGAKSNL
jgi:hypothetical protein